MKTIIAALIAGIALSGCVVYSDGYLEGPVVAYEPAPVVGLYTLGFFDVRFGYWTGYGWDRDFYREGHGGYRHYYGGAPREAFRNYRTGPHYSRRYENRDPLPRHH